MSRKLNEVLTILEKEGRIKLGNMFFRRYNPVKDRVCEKYPNDDWQKILGETTEDDLVDLNNCSNVVIYLWCDMITEVPHGMLYLEEDFKNPGYIIFHGGTWNHDFRYYNSIFESLIKLFYFLINLGYGLLTTCSVDNITADKFQKALGFEEISKEDNIINKKLDIRKFLSLPLTTRFFPKK